MTTVKDHLARNSDELREQAEIRLQSKNFLPLEILKSLTPEETQLILHDLQVHQIELEMQVEELQRTQRELDAARSRYFDLYDLAPVGYCTLSANELILEANLSIAILLGLPKGEFMGQPITRFIFKEDQDIYYRFRNQFFAKELPQILELRLVKKDNTVFWGHLTVTLSSNVDGFPFFRVILRDITARKQSENELQESKDFLATLINANPFPIYYKDKDCRYLGCNKAYETFFGIQSDQLIGKTVFDIHPLELAKVYHAKDVEFFEQGKTPQQFESQAKDVHGVLQDVIFKRAAFFDRQGTIKGLIGTLVDITERKQAEMDLRESEEKFRTVADYTYDWEYWIDPAGRILYISPSCERVTGYKAEEFLQDPELLNRIVHAGDRDTFMQHLINIRNNEANAVCEPPDFRIHTRSGEERWIAHVCQEVFNKKGESLGRRASNRDITERKRAEKEQEVLRTQLIQAQKMESVGRLAGGVAHDFNNMLSVILGYTELALDKVEPSDPLRKYLLQIFDAGKRSADITRQLLAFARKQTIAPKVLDLNETVESMLKMLRRLIGEDVNLAWLPGIGLWPVKIDPSQMDQLLANLCVNARDAIKGVGKITIETGIVTFDEAYCADHLGFIPGDFILLSVSDDGCGMDKEILDKIFEPFFTTKEEGQGTGLGLAMVYGIVKQNNGFVNVYSEPGQGTTFNIYLPCHEGEAEEIRETLTTEIPSGHGEMILIVEDEVAILELGRTLLERFGYTVLTASTPGEALLLAKVHANEIHLLITDIVMPEMNGRQLADQLHTLYPNIKPLFMSGYTANVIAHRGILDEGVNFMHKPFSAKDLATKVHAALWRG